MSRADGWAVGWSADRNGTCDQIDAAWEQITGQSTTYARGLGWLDVVHEADRAAVRRQIEQAGAREVAFRIRARLRDTGGNECWAMIVGAARHDDDGTFRGFTGTISDCDDCYEPTRELSARHQEYPLAAADGTGAVTEQRKAEEALRSSQALLSAVLDGTFDSIFLKDKQCRLLLANRAVFVSLGKTPEQCIGKTDEEYFDNPAEGRACMDNDFRIMTTGIAESVVETLQTPTGTRYYRSNKSPYRDGAGNVIGIIGTARDITDQANAELALRMSEQRYRTLVDATSAVTWRLSPSGLVVGPLPDWSAFTGQTTEEAMGMGWTAVLHPDDVAPTLEFGKKRLTDQRSFSISYRLRRRDGVWRWMSVLGTPIRNAGGKVVEWFGMNIDVTDRREADEALRASQEALARSQRIEAIGRLAGGIAHDFNNLLTIVSGNLSLAEMRITDAKTRTQVRKAIEAVKLGGDLTRRLLSFAGRRMLAPSVVDLNEQVVDVAHLLRQTLGEVIRLETQLGRGLWKIRVDAGEIESAIVNIALNARDAMPNGGRLTIATSNATLNAAQANELAIRPGDYVCLTITDDGQGMTPEVAIRATEPFFTTKQDSDRSGLGLSSVYGFAVRTNGGFKISSEVGVGTSTMMYLPRSLEESGMATSSELQPTTKREIVLVVDDNELVRDVTEQLLEALGYEVMVARNGTEAIEVVTRNNDVRVIFSDVVMPGGMSGYDIARWVGANRPNVKVLLASGYVDAESQSGNEQSLTVLGKPYSHEALSEAMRRLLAD